MTFSVYKYGYDEAKASTIEWRIAMDKKFNIKNGYTTVQKIE